MTEQPAFERVTLFRGNGSVLVRFRFTVDTHTASTFLFGLWGRSKDGDVVRQFGVKYLDGERIAYFVFDHSAGEQVNEDAVVPTEGPLEVLVPWPTEPFDALGDSPSISAYLTIDGVDVVKDFEVELVA